MKLETVINKRFVVFESYEPVGSREPVISKVVFGSRIPNSFVTEEDAIEAILKADLPIYKYLILREISITKVKVDR